MRPGIPADVGALAALDALVSPSPWSAAQFDAGCSAGVNAGKEQLERTLVYALAAEVQAFVVFSMVLDEACIHNIAVHPALQGGGLGQLLLRSALDGARDCGAVSCYLEVRASNLAARRLYEKFHFQHDGVRKAYYPTAAGREDALLMSRQL